MSRTKQEIVTVVPSPDLPANDYLPGIGAAGRSLPLEEAQPLLDAGLIVLVTSKPAPPVNKEAD